MIFRVIVFLILVVPVWVVIAGYDTAVQPQVATDLAIRAVNGNDQDAALLRANQRASDWPNYVAAGWTLLIGAACFAKPITSAFKEKN